MDNNILPCINRDISWIDFNERVLEEGLRKDLVPFERLKYLSIVSSNFDEFFMVRVAAMKSALEAGIGPDISGLDPRAQLKLVSEKVRSISLLSEMTPPEGPTTTKSLYMTSKRSSA